MKRTAFTILGACLLLLFSACDRKASVAGTEFSWRNGGDPGTVTGIVISRSGTKPVGGLRIHGSSTSGGIHTACNDHGEFKLIVGGRHLLEIGVHGSTLKKKMNCTKGLQFIIQIE